MPSPRLVGLLLGASKPMLFDYAVRLHGPMTHVKPQPDSFKKDIG